MKTYLNEWINYVDIPLDQLSSETRMAESTIQKFIDQEKTPSLSQLAIFSEVLNVSLDDLIHRDPFHVRNISLIREYLQMYITAKGINVKTIADETGIDEIIIQSWLDGVRNPSLEEFVTLSTTLNVSMDELMGLSLNDIILKAFRKLPVNQFVYQTDQYAVINRLRMFMTINCINYKSYIVRVNTNVRYFMIVYYADQPLTPKEVSKIMKQLNSRKIRKKESDDFLHEKYDDFECIDLYT